MVTSRRLQAAASAEARRLIKRRDRISQRIAPLQAEIDAIDERIALIEKAAGLALAHVTRRGQAVALVAASTLIAASGVALIAAGEVRAAADPSLDWRPGVMSHYGPPDEPAGEQVACGRGVIPPGIHGGAMRDVPCGSLVVTCLADLSRCVQWRVTDYGPGIASRSHDALGHTFSAIAPLSRGVVSIQWRVRTAKPRCVPRWVKTYWRPAQGASSRYAPTCGTAAAR